MHPYSLSHVGDEALLHDLRALVARERVTTAQLLAHIAEVDARRLYLPAGFPSMRAYCVGELRLSEDAAYKRIQAARAARQFPAIFTALADGRLHLTGLGLLAPHLTPENATELLSAAVNKTKSDIEQLLAQRFPRTELMALVQAIPASAPSRQLAPAQVEPDAPERVEACAVQLAPAQVATPVARPRVEPIASERFAVQFMISKGTHDKLRYAQGLLSHRLPTGDLAEVFDRALDTLIGQLEKQKFAATSRPRLRSRQSSNPRHIPAYVRRAVWKRDQGQCTFVSEQGRRCTSRNLLEYDHIEPVARGGLATVEGLRLRCRAHNQYEAERAFGAGFMNEKREEARRASEARRRAAEAARLAAEARARAAAAHQAAAREVIPWLRALGIRDQDARQAAAHCETIPDAPLEERVRLALRSLHVRARCLNAGRGAPGTAS